MILLHTIEGEIMINPKYVLYITQTSFGSNIYYGTNNPCFEYNEFEVKETPSEIKKLIDQFYIPF